MSQENWADKEIADLKVQKEKLEEEEERENIWRQAFSRPEEKWRLPAALEETIRQRGDLRGKSSAVAMDVDNPSWATDFFKFKRLLVIGACEYLERHPPPDNRITSLGIYYVLRSSREFGHIVSRGTIIHWMTNTTAGFQDIVEDFAIDKHPMKSLDERYAQAIKKWWREHPNSDESPTFKDLAMLLKRTNSAVRSAISGRPALLELVKNRPKELE